MRKAMTLHVPPTMDQRLAKLQGEAMLEGHRLSLQDVLRGLLEHAVEEVERHETAKDRVSVLRAWIGLSRVHSGDIGEE